jgi:HPr kinase/phosphorylase
MSSHQREIHHGVMMKINQAGVLIIGEPNVGKSTFALELLHHGHQLISDDIVEFDGHSNSNVTGHCPPLLSGFLHTRELGLINISEVFGRDAFCHQFALNYVVELKLTNENCEVNLSIEKESYLVCGMAFPKLSLLTNSPASLIHRLTTWMKMQVITASDVDFSDRQRKLMALS